MARKQKHAPAIEFVCRQNVELAIITRNWDAKDTHIHTIGQTVHGIRASKNFSENKAVRLHFDDNFHWILLFTHAHSWNALFFHRLERVKPRGFANIISIFILSSLEMLCKYIYTRLYCKAPFMYAQRSAHSPSTSEVLLCRKHGCISTRPYCAGREHVRGASFVASINLCSSMYYIHANKAELTVIIALIDFSQNHIDSIYNLDKHSS